jgi:hypothetical protein
MLEFLDLAWLHWPSFIVGGASALVGCVLLVILPLAGGEAWLRFRTWRENRRAVAAALEMQERSPVEEVRTLSREAIERAQGIVSRARARRDLGVYLPTAPRIPSARRSSLLDHDEAERLFRMVMGEPGR